MTNYEQLKTRAETLKAKRDRALGAAEQIENGWLKTYGTKDPEELRKKLESLRTNLGSVQAEYMEKMETVEKLLDGAGA